MGPQTRNVKTPSESAGKEKRKPVRRDPERRRQQNLQAQRKYREKLRERMGRLEALASSATENHTVESTPTADTSLSRNVSLTSYSTPTHTIANTLPVCDVSDPSISSSSAATPEECQKLIPQLDDTLLLNMWDWTTLAPHSYDTPSLLGICDSTTQAPQSKDTSLALNIWDSSTHIDPSLLVSDKCNNDRLPYWTSTMECSCSNPHFQIQTQNTGPFRPNEYRLLRLRQSAPDPYANNLRIDTVCTITAMLNLAMHIGITEEMLCADESLSPFFRPSAESTGDLAKANIISAVQRIFKTLKPDLRPSSEQITVQHHPYIDILPFPTLRKNLITHPEDFDEDEFSHDIVTGLVCWGGAGIGRRDRQESTGYTSTGTPWDVRSWEARVWFLKKYWSMLGGEDGELVRQSEWWRSIRGDDTLNVEADD
ncbi:hypothetical protein BO71DRAFT_452410 [Aspergillus ellipticus CBS 707.79]|uniref:BZIP domain-containing protein n=1 Tax=Aspergillus ellipticus CBS 707.79 TaxID=1448320 RepID=A0A319D966_9EURO|nr:hypothetical protein BO71DRAFT_452410 [Aspergillus ellipticus CBS 707.79]